MTTIDEIQNFLKEYNELISIVILVVYLILSLIRNKIILKIKTYQN